MLKSMTIYMLMVDLVSNMKALEIEALEISIAEENL